MAKNVTTEYLDRRFDEFEVKLEDKFVTKEEFSAFRSENASRQDEMITILQRLDQECIFSTEWIRRIENDLLIVKKHLKLA